MSTLGTISTRIRGAPDGDFTTRLAVSKKWFLALGHTNPSKYRGQHITVSVANRKR
jgi:hypothetical protein